MAEDQGKKEEEKFEFDSAGQALGYISLDQARILAMRTAREAPGDYGRRFRNVPMAFEAVEDNETEDHYRVTLSFRPQGQCTGGQQCQSRRPQCSVLKPGERQRLRTHFVGGARPGVGGARPGVGGARPGVGGAHYRGW